MSKDRPAETSRTVACRLDRGLDAQAFLCCPGCRSELYLHQPDLDHPDRLLGTCPGCRSWFILDESARSGEVVRLQVPEAKVLLRTKGEPALPAAAPLKDRDDDARPRANPRTHPPR